MSTFILVIVVLASGIWLGFGVGFVTGVSWMKREAAKDLPGRKPPVLVWLIIISTGVLLMSALITSLHTWHFTHIAQRTHGTVIELLSKTDKDSGSVSYAPTFRFQDATGISHTVSSSLYVTPAMFHVGDRVSVLYRSDTPQSACIDNYWELWGLSIMLGIFGVLELVIGLILLSWPKIKAGFINRTTGPPTA